MPANVKRILVITYWSYQEPLIQNYTLPYIRLMLDVLPEGARVSLVTMEKPSHDLGEVKKDQVVKSLAQEGIDWEPDRYHRFGFLAALRWTRLIMKWMFRAWQGGFQVVHAWGTPAGAPAYWVARWSGTPLVLDSFEPHAESMVEAGQWKKGSIAHRALLFLEKLQARCAEAVIAVSPTMEAYSWSRYRALHPSFSVKPACVDIASLEANARRYAHLPPNTEGRVVGVYAGKFGGIYLVEETFLMIKAAYEEWGDRFFMFLLTDLSENEVQEHLKKNGIPEKVLHQEWVAPEEVPAYLAKAHFALNPVRPLPSKRHCTSIKDGEYWGMGLPVLIPEGIGEDARIIRERRIGVVMDKQMDPSSIREGMKEMRGLLEEESSSSLYQKARMAAIEERGFDRAWNAYRDTYGGGWKEPLTVLLVAYYRHDDPVFQSALLDYFKRIAPERELRAVLLTFEDEAPSESLERTEAEWTEEGIFWERVRFGKGKMKSLQKGMDFVKGVWKGKRMVETHGIDIVYSEGFPSAIIGHHISKRSKIPHVVHTYEPHAEYMTEGGIWKPDSWEYRFTKRYERKVGKEADVLITGTNRMKERMEKIRGAGTVLRIPSSVDLAHFEYSPEGRERVRQEYGIPSEAMVITYLGKMGGMYYDEELFELFNTFCEELPGKELYFMILTSMPVNELLDIARKKGTDTEKLIIKELGREEVPDHLSSADIALSGVRQTPSKAYCSPIKHGEYWGCGLPVLIFKGISEDDDLVEAEGSGVVIEDPGRDPFRKAVAKTLSLLEEKPEVLRARCRRTAEKERSLEKAREKLRDLLFPLGRRGRQRSDRKVRLGRGTLSKGSEYE